MIISFEAADKKRNLRMTGKQSFPGTQEDTLFLSLFYALILDRQLFLGWEESSHYEIVVDR